MSRRLPTLAPRKVIQALERGGFFVHHTTGSHYALRHPADPTIRVTVPLHTRDLKRGTLHSIIKQARIAVGEFLELL
jgi:predicted RNA binding protein YcfA (HicA-like mRNA interferase family)